jgi:spore maturation protein CgeB
MRAGVLNAMHGAPDASARSAVPRRYVVLGLSITSSWGNGHATTYRSLLRALAARGHDILFLERDVQWYRDNRDMPSPDFCRTALYTDTSALTDRFAVDVRDADVVIVGSYVPDGIVIGEWVLNTAQGVVAFYDIDTPVTLAGLSRHACDYLTPDLVRRYPLYLSFTGGPTLDRLEQQWGSPKARALYCSIDPGVHYPDTAPVEYDLGYMGTYSDDRQPTVDRLLGEPARGWPEGRFVVAGPLYPAHLQWPPNVQRITHLPPAAHRAFFSGQRFTLNVTRRDMIEAGWSPSVRLFEAAACGTPIVSDHWEGLDAFFTPGTEIMVTNDAQEVIGIVRDMPEEERVRIGAAARVRVLTTHTAAHRAAELDAHVDAHRPA